MKTLECSSAGDRRFSAFYAKVKFDGALDTIENHYQRCKRNIAGHVAGKGHRVDHVILFNKRFEPSILTPFYRYLWYIYLKGNPELVAYARQFNNFTDKFRGKAINCQADCVKAFVERDQAFYACIKPLLKINN